MSEASPAACARDSDGTAAGVVGSTNRRRSTASATSTVDGPGARFERSIGAVREVHAKRKREFSTRQGRALDQSFRGSLMTITSAMYCPSHNPYTCYAQTAVNRFCVNCNALVD